MELSDRKIDRRRMLKNLAVASAGATLAPYSTLSAASRQDITDGDIFTFALNLEYLEAEYYLRATTGQGLSFRDRGGTQAGSTRGGRRVNFVTDAFQQIAKEIADDELAHVQYLRDTLGAAAVPRPAIDFTNAFNAAGIAAGLGPFDPFADEISFLLGAFVFEDVGVTAYKGAAPLIRNDDLLADAAGVLAVEAYHAGNVRSVLFQQGREVRMATSKISDARDSLDGATNLDQGVFLGTPDGRPPGAQANIVPTDSRGIAFARTAQQVLNIVYLTSGSGVRRGGFFPEGVNGRINTT